MVTTRKLQMPKGGLFDASGTKLTSAGLHYLSELGDRLAFSPTQDASEVLSGGTATVYAQSLWDTMVSDVSAGVGSWSPDLTQKLDFVRTVTGVSTINYPIYELGDPNLFYSVLVTQGNGGGWAVSMGAGFVGAAPVVLTGSGDQTLLGFKLLGPATWTGWTVKQMPAS